MRCRRQPLKSGAWNEQPWISSPSPSRRGSRLARFLSNGLDGRYQGRRTRPPRPRHDHRWSPCMGYRRNAGGRRVRRRARGGTPPGCGALPLLLRGQSVSSRRRLGLRAGRLLVLRPQWSRVALRHWRYAPRLHRPARSFHARPQDSAPFGPFAHWTRTLAFGSRAIPRHIRRP